MRIPPPLRLSTSMAAFCLVAGPLPALAQISPTNQIIGCQSVESDDARLECFDRVAARLSGTAQAPTAAVSAPAVPKLRPAEVPLVSAPAPALAPTPSPVLAPMPTPAAPTPLYTKAASIAPETNRTIDNFGKSPEDAVKPKEKALLTPKGDVVFTVKQVQIFNHVKKRFYMTNGQVWEQTTAANIKIDEGKAPAGTTAKISKSGFGGYKMKINDKKWAVKVKRVR